MDFEDSSDDEVQITTQREKMVSFSVSSDPPSESDIKGFDEYDALYRLRHDLVHQLICDSRGVQMGEIQVHKIIPEIKESSVADFVMNQTPDIITRVDNKITITEIAVTRSRMAEARKRAKYSLLVQALKEIGFDVELEPIIMNVESNENDMHEFCRQHNVQLDKLMACFHKVVEVEKMIRTIEFQHPDWVEERENMSSMIDHPTEITIEELITEFHESERKPFNSVADLREVLNSPSSADVTDLEQTMIDQMVDYVVGDEELELTKQNKLNLELFWQKHDEMVATYLQERSGHHISVFPLPYIPCQTVASLPRDTSNDEDIIRQFKKRLLTTGDSYLISLSQMNIRVFPKEAESFKKRKLIRKESECIGKPRIDSDTKFQNSVQGPGRKKYLRGPNISRIHLEAQREKSLYTTGSQLDTSDLDSLFVHFSQKKSLSSLNPDEMSGPGLNYLRFCQEVMREVNLNFLRKEVTKNHILKPTIINGVYIVIHAGPPFKTGAINTLVWFKVLVDLEVTQLDYWSKSWMFKSLELLPGNVAQSKWLSSDPHRLDHYIRGFDRIVMSYCAKLQQSYDQKREAYTISELWNLDDSDSLGVMITIYLEDKRCTSKMLQDVRYVVMTTISNIRYWSDMLKKFEEPIRSPLQLHLLRRIVSFIKTMMSKTIKEVFLHTKWGRNETDVFDQQLRFCASEIYLPRILTKCNNKRMILFPELLSEMYFTMLFNKDQDDPTHSSFQVLQKILEGEEALEEVKTSPYPLHTGRYKDPMSDFQYLLRSKKKTHQFSRDVVILASKLQQKHSSNQSLNGLAHKKANHFHKVNQTLDRFATFKSSATFEHDFYDEKQIGYMQNKRRRCIEGCLDLIEKGCCRSTDVVNMTRSNETCFQVFKKNQIGGVREILILDIATRIRLNVLESYSRSICMQDKREMLTHGDKKNSYLLNIQKNLRLDPEVKGILHHNFDKKRWGPSFMPMQFLYLFKPYQNVMGTYFNLFVWLLLKHTNKRCYYPDHLIQAWLNHPDKKHVRDPLLTAKKEEFLRSKRLYFLNESNMGQGILHYTSSYFHLAVVSLREHIYSEACKRRGLKPCRVEDLISSDDSYTALAINDLRFLREHLILFLRAQSVVERLMNVETSRSKSSSSLLVGEFNSLFLSNLSLYPTTMKFALSSVYAFSTDSFDLMVKESFNASRSLLENGGTVELFELSHKLNKKYCESIYHTYPGGHNDPSIILKLPRNFIPYQYGVYPMSHVVSNLFFGPESHNLAALDASNNDEAVLKLLSAAHTTLESDHLSIYADIASDVSTGLRTIVAVNRVDRRLRSLMKKWNIVPQELSEKIIQDPLFVFRTPIDKESVRLITAAKLFVSSAIDAMKVSSGSLYFGRISAAPFSTIFRVRGSKDLLTFRECIIKMSEWPGNVDITMSHYNNSLALFKDVNSIIQDIAVKEERMTLEARNYVKMSLSEFVTEVSNPIPRILQYVWDDKTLVEANSSLNRDWLIIQRVCPMFSNDLSETISKLSSDKAKAVSILSLLISRLMSYKSSQMTAFLFGLSQRNPLSTAEVIVKQNTYIGLTSLSPPSSMISSGHYQKIENMKALYNEWALRSYFGLNTSKISAMVDLDIIEMYCSSSGCPVNHKKKFLMMLLHLGLVTSISRWTKMTDTLITNWVLPQKRIGDKWRGRGLLLAYYGSAKCQIEIDEKDNFDISLETSGDIRDNGVLIRKTVQEILGNVSLDDLTIRKYCGAGSFSLRKGRLYNDFDSSTGFHINTRPLPAYSPIPFKVKFNEKTMLLVDINHKKIFETILGLFNVERVFEPITGEDFKVHKMPFSSLLKNSCFSSNFLISALSDKKCLEILGDLDVDVSLLSPTTYNFFKKMNVREELKRNRKNRVIDTSKSINFDIDFSNFDLGEIQNMMPADIMEPDYDISADIYDPNDAMDFEVHNVESLADFFNLTKKESIVQPGQYNLWLKILYLRPILITKLYAPTVLVNKTMILQAIQTDMNPEVIISLMIIRDLILSHGKDAKSPPVSLINVGDTDLIAQCDYNDASWDEYYENQIANMRS